MKHLTGDVISLSTGGEHCFNYELPTCVIPDSSKATISVTGERALLTYLLLGLLTLKDIWVQRRNRSKWNGIFPLCMRQSDMGIMASDITLGIMCIVHMYEQLTLS